MDFKRWLKEEKGGGGFGAFLIFIIIAASIYAVQFGGSNLLYEPEPDFTTEDFIPPAEEYTRERPPVAEPINTNHRLYDSSANSHALSTNANADDREENRESENKPAVMPKPENKAAVMADAKTKSKPKAKPKRKLISPEELVKRRLKQGKTVKQIADETGLEKKYIREVRRRTQQVVW
ncbi:MAG: hypothetical protein JWQ14_2827 [Adhaeribacter sp.]|nr:hypothetical protein [Adhaeribacter sp.]